MVEGKRYVLFDFLLIGNGASPFVEIVILSLAGSRAVLHLFARALLQDLVFSAILAQLLGQPFSDHPLFARLLDLRYQAIFFGQNQILDNKVVLVEQLS